MLIGKKIMLAAPLMFCAVGGSVTPVAAADDCAAGRKAISTIRAQIKADQSRIVQLKPRITTDELNEWTNAAEERRKQILVQSFRNSAGLLFDHVLSEPEMLWLRWTLRAIISLMA